MSYAGDHSLICRDIAKVFAAAFLVRMSQKRKVGHGDWVIVALRVLEFREQQAGFQM